jgi:hypothetical protein
MLIGCDYIHFIQTLRAWLILHFKVSVTLLSDSEIRKFVRNYHIKKLTGIVGYMVDSSFNGINAVER